MFETEDILISRNYIKQINGMPNEGLLNLANLSNYDFGLCLTKHKTYTLTNKFFSIGVTWFEFMDDNNMTINFTLQQFERYFLSKREIRRLKLKTLSLA